MAKIEKPAAANIAPPPKSQPFKSDHKKDPVPPATSKPAPGDIKPLQFKLPALMHQDIKLYAVQQNLSMTDLFLEMYREYRAKHG
jgi:hypothetical protein